jgi:hypothetical protein
MGFCSIFRRNNLNVPPTCQWGKYLPRSPSEVPESPDNVYRKNANKAKSSQTPQSPANQSSSDDRQARQARPVPSSRTTSVNSVAVARSGHLNSKSESKKPTKKPVIEISDPEDDDSESLERGAALASPAKGAESRTTEKVSKSLYIFF